MGSTCLATEGMKSTGYLLLQQDESSDLNGAYQELRIAEELLDVTLACEDETLQAHKVVLSASSSFFRSLFRKTKQSSPIIFLHGVLYKDLTAMLDYIYTGETQILAEDMDRFIKVATDLKIKALSAIDDEDKAENTNHVSEESVVDQLNIASEKLVNLENKMNDMKKEPGEKSLEQLAREISEKIERLPDNDGLQMWKCTVCGKVGKKFKLKTHVEIHLEGYSHKCLHCGKAHKTRSALSGHMYYVHKDVQIKSLADEEEDNDNILNTSDNKDMKQLLKEIAERMEEVPDGEGATAWKCTECGKIAKRKDNIQNHVETHLEGFSHRCAQCNKSSKTRGALAAHIKIHTKLHKDNEMHKDDEKHIDDEMHKYIELNEDNEM